jgi:hypothetical protein
MRAVNRAVIVVKPKEACLKWANEVALPHLVQQQMRIVQRSAWAAYASSRFCCS